MDNSKIGVQFEVDERFFRSEVDGDLCDRECCSLFKLSLEHESIRTCRGDRGRVFDLASRSLCLLRGVDAGILTSMDGWSS